MEDFAFNIFDALDNIEDFNCDQDGSECVTENSSGGLLANTSVSETDFLADMDILLQDTDLFVTV